MKPRIMKVRGMAPQTQRPAVATGNNPEKIIELKKKLAEIEEVTIPKIINRRSEAAAWGDLSENAGYAQANDDLALYQSMARSIKLEIKHLEEGT